MPVMVATGLSDGRGCALAPVRFAIPSGHADAAQIDQINVASVANRIRTESWACAWREPVIIFQRDARQEAVEA